MTSTRNRPPLNVIRRLSRALIGRVRVSDGGGGSPTVFTLVLDDLLATQYVFGYDQNLVLSATGDFGSGSTAPIPIDSTDAPNAEILTSAIEGALQLLVHSGGSEVSVSGVTTNAGDTFTFTISVAASLGAISVTINEASSQFYPTITLTEAVTQQGSGEQFANALLVAYEDMDGNGFVQDSYGNSITGVSGIWTPTAASDWQTSGSTSACVFTYVIAGDPPSGAPTLASGDGYVTDYNPYAAGQQEVHTITPTPTYPTGGNWKPLGVGGSVGYAASPYSIQLAINDTGTPNGTVAVTGDPISSGVSIVTWDADVSADDNELSPVNVDLTAPEITHSITPA